MYLKDAIKRLQDDLYTLQLAIHCYSFVKGQKGYHLFYYLNGDLYYDNMWLPRGGPVYDLSHLSEILAGGKPLFDLTDLDSLFESDPGNWTVITPEQLYDYNEQQFAKESS